MREIKTSFDGEYTSIKFSGFEVRIKGKAEGLVRKKSLETDIWRHDKPVKSEEHPTMKPVALCERAILNSSKREGIVLDLFLGSGSTLIACEKAVRTCYGMEISEHYCSVILKRWEDFTGQKANRVVCGQ
jgi:DNA modification methylase